jgi:hypothetical protein
MNETELMYIDVMKINLNLTVAHCNTNIASAFLRLRNTEQSAIIQRIETVKCVTN